MPNINYQLFRRQFYIGQAEKKINESWISFRLKSGLILSHCKTLPFKVVNNTTGKQWVLLGDAIQSLESEASPEVQLANCMDEATIKDIYYSWVGRWVLIGDETLHTDAACLLGCFYSIASGILEIASVPSLITNKDVPDTFIIKYASGIEFYPPPDSGFKDVSKLLPSQTLSITTGKPQYRSLQYEVPKLSYEQTIHYLCGLLNTTLRNAYKEKSKKIVLALTAGYDSRLLMASLNYCGIPYDAITFDYPLIKPADKTVPKRLAAISDIPYRLIKRRSPKKENLEKYTLHSSGHAVERDKEYMLYQQIDELEGGNTILLRAGCFEIASSKTRTRLPQNIIDGESISKIFKGNNIQAQSLQKWVDWIKKTPHSMVDWRDRYYWEQRVCGWLSCTEQALDLVNIERFIPSNSFLFYNIMFGIPEEIRLKKQHQVDMIKMLSPELLTVPFNPSMSSLYKRYLRFISRFENRRKKKYNY